jgi:hypothetical protein
VACNLETRSGVRQRSADNPVKEYTEMSTIMPKSELVKRALEWISEKCKEGGSFQKLVDEAAMRFNLSPKDVEFLNKFFKSNPE